MMKIRLAKKIMKADPYDDYPSKHPSPYWKAKFNEAMKLITGMVALCSAIMEASANIAISSTTASKKQ